MLAVLLATVALAPSPSPADSGLRVTVDSSRHLVVLTTAPADVAPMTGGMVAMHEHPDPVIEFAFPVSGWLRGAHLVLTDSAGRALPASLIHHLNLVNFSRRQLLYPAYERTLALGQETGDIVLPKTVGVPIRAGMPMGLLVAYANTTGRTIAGARARLELLWTPANQLPAPTDVFPVYMDVVDPIGRSSAFDLPPGPSSYHADFTFPISGRIIGVGGHIHDYGTGISLDDITGKAPQNVVHLGTRRRPDGTILGVERKFPGITGAGIRLAAGRRYRVTGTYDNPTGRTLPDGAMVHLIYLFVPDRTGEWPAADTNDAELRHDRARLDHPPMGAAAGGM
jgi:hypothetical protein